MCSLCRRSGVVAFSLFVLSACAPHNPIGISGRTEVSWPAAPEVERIAYLGEFSSGSDLGIKEGFWRSLIRFAAGPASSSLVRPMDVSVTGDGDMIYVADPEANCLHR